MSRRIVVTGGGTGIGYACAEWLCVEAPRLHLVGRRKTVLADAAARLVVAGAAEVTIHSCDLTDPAAVGVLAGDLEGDPIHGTRPWIGSPSRSPASTPPAAGAARAHGRS